MIHGFVHVIRSFIKSFLHPIKKGASVVPTLQMRKPRPERRCPAYQLVAGRDPQSLWAESCLLGTQLSFQRLQVRAAAGSRLWYFFSFLFCFLSDESPFWGPSCLSPDTGRPCLGKETRSVRDLPAEGGQPAGALGTPRPPCELLQPRLPGHEAWASMGTLPAEPRPVPWAGPGSDLVGELQGPFGLGRWPSVSLPFILGPSTGNLLSLILELTPACQALCLAWEGLIGHWENPGGIGMVLILSASTSFSAVCPWVSPFPSLGPKNWMSRSQSLLFLLPVLGRIKISCLKGRT